MKEIGIPKTNCRNQLFKDQHGNPRSVPVLQNLNLPSKLKLLVLDPIIPLPLQKMVLFMHEDLQKPADPV